MDQPIQPRFQRGELVMYVGRLPRVSGWLFQVSAVRSTPGREPHYDLFDEVWKLRVTSVRESDLRGPDDLVSQTAATATGGVAPPASCTAGR